MEATHLAQLVASTCAFLDPELIVLGAVACGLELAREVAFTARMEAGRGEPAPAVPAAGPGR
jgi:hypothetical protein